MPQNRERLILLGARKGEPLPDYPEPQTNIAGKRQRSGDLPDGPTCADALGDLPDADGFDALLDSDAVGNGGLRETLLPMRPRCAASPTTPGIAAMSASGTPPC